MEKISYTNGTLQKTVYSPNNGYETAKIASNGATQNTTYYSVNNTLAAKKNPDGSKNYYLTDNLGYTNVLTNQRGGVLEKTIYYPYGQIRSGGAQSKFLYTGQENDPETGLVYYHSRYYSPQMQRFVQPDTQLPNIYDPQQLNRYAYVGNNPITYNDPTGHCFWDACVVEGIGVFELSVLAIGAVAALEASIHHTQVSHAVVATVSSV